MLLLLLYPKHVIKLLGYNLGCYTTSLNPIAKCQATIMQVRGHMAISPMDIQVFSHMKVRVPIIKSNSNNHPMMLNMGK